MCSPPPLLFELAHFEAPALHGQMASYFSLTKIPKEESLGYLLSQTSTKQAPTVFVDQKLFPWKRSLFLGGEGIDCTPHWGAPPLALQNHVQPGRPGACPTSKALSSSPGPSLHLK